MTHLYVLANWHLNPTFVKKVLGIRMRLEKDNKWQVLKKFDFGELAYNYEEGLKFSCEIDKLLQLVQYICDFHKQHNIPFKTPKGYHIFSARLNGLGGGLPTYEDKFKQAHLHQDQRFDFVWNLEGEPN